MKQPWAGIWVAVAAVACWGCSSKPGMSFGDGLDVPYVRTPAPVVRAMLELAGVKPGEMVVDLGCGDGRMALMAVTEFGARARGYDLDPVRVGEARANARLAGVEERASFEVCDVMEAEVGEADVVVMYLIPMLIESLKGKLEGELGVGTRVVSHSFPVRGWKAERTVVVEGRTVYLYRMGERAALRRR